MPSVSVALCLSQNITSVFSLPEFAPRTGIGSMRDVSDFSVDVNNLENLTTAKLPAISVTAFSKQAIRIINVKSDSLVLTKTIDYPGALTGVRRSSYALVATSSAYDLVDLDNTRKIPLFPVQSLVSGEENEGSYKEAIKPLVIPVGTDEFLVTSGTTIEEPAMGIVVNVDGDISRGTIPWPKSPSSVAVNNPYVAAVIDKNILIHSLYDQALIQTIEYQSQPLLSHVLTTYSVPYQPLAEKLRLVPLNNQDQERIEREKEIAEKNCILESSLFVYTDDIGVECLVPKPRLFYLENLVLNGKLDDVSNELEKFEPTTVSKVLELEYMSLFVSLGHILHENYDSALESSSVLDPRIFIWTVDKTHIYGDIWTFNGILPLMNKIEPSMEFYHFFLKHLLSKREAESISDKVNVFKSIEMSLLSLSDTRDEYLDVIDNHIHESFDEAVEYLASKNMYFYLSRLYETRKMSKEVLNIWKKLLTGSYSDPEFSHGSEKMEAYLIQCNDKDLVMNYGIWLVENYPEQGILVFTSSSRTSEIDDDELISKLKALPNDRAWREYLKYLVYIKKSKLFTGDLVAFLLDDLIERVESQKSVVMKELGRYKALDLPKPSFLHFLNGETIIHNNPSSEIARLRLEFISLLLTEENYDAQLVLNRLQQGYHQLLGFELAIVSSKLGLHESSLDIFFDLTDISSMVDYCKRGILKVSTAESTQVETDPQIQEDFAKIVLHKFLTLKDQKQRLWSTRLLLEECGHRIDLTLLIKELPGEWPIEVLGKKLEQHFNSAIVDKNKSTVYRALSRSEEVFITKQLKALKEY